MIEFIAGLIIGGALGTLTMCLLSHSRYGDDYASPDD